MRSQVGHRLVAGSHGPRSRPVRRTRRMWSSGLAFSHTVKQFASRRLKVAGSDTRPPGVAITARACRAERFLQRAPLVAPIRVRPVKRMDLRDAAAGDALDLAREFDERHPEIVREPRAERRLPRSTQPDQRDPVLAARGRWPVEQPDKATRAWRRSASSRFASRSRISNHSGDDVVTSPISSASGQCSAMAICCRTRIDALPIPYSRFARWRSETSAACATALRVMPRRARSVRTRSPSATSSGCFDASASRLPAPGSSAAGSRSALRWGKCRIVLARHACRHCSVGDSCTIMHMPWSGKRSPSKQRAVACSPSHGLDDHSAARSSETFNFAAAPVRGEPARRDRTAFIDDRRNAQLRRARAKARGASRRRSWMRAASRRARPAADARHQRLAGGVPRVPVRGGRPCRGQHAAHRRRLRVHDRALPRAGRRRVCGPAAGAASGACEGTARGASRRRLATGSPLPAGAGARSTRSWPATPLAPGARRPRTTSRSGCTRPARPAARKAPCTRTPILTGPPSCTASACWGCPRATSCSRRPSCSSPTVLAMR